ncbi:MAG: hypothetical protein AAF585_09345 [Verrucomicrobiota bacterium]
MGWSQKGAGLLATTRATDILEFYIEKHFWQLEDGVAADGG